MSLTYANTKLSALPVPQLVAQLTTHAALHIKARFSDFWPEMNSNELYNIFWLYFSLFLLFAKLFGLRLL